MATVFKALHGELTSFTLIKETTQGFRVETRSGSRVIPRYRRYPGFVGGFIFQSAVAGLDKEEAVRAAHDQAAAYLAWAEDHVSRAKEIMAKGSA